MAEHMRLAGRTAVITGAGGGIGRAIALSLARRGCHLALADIDEAGMAETVNLVREHGVRVSRHRVDVADRIAVAEFPDLSPPSIQVSTCLLTMLALRWAERSSKFPTKISSGCSRSTSGAWCA